MKTARPTLPRCRDAPGASCRSFLCGERSGRGFLVDDLERHARGDGEALTVFVFRRDVQVTAGVFSDLNAHLPETGLDVANLAIDAKSLDGRNANAERRGFVEEHPG